jgi:hypothetical protein
VFGAGWVILFLGAWSFGMRELLGIEQVMACRRCIVQSLATIATGASMTGPPSCDMVRSTLRAQKHLSHQDGRSVPTRG